MSWARAPGQCDLLTGFQGKVVSIDSAAEEAALHILVQRPDVNWGGQYVWTGGVCDSGVSTCVWMPSRTRFGEYSNWLAQPATGSQNFLSFVSISQVRHGWVPRANGEEEFNFICEVESDPDPETPVPCDEANDLVIVMDGSGSISPAEFIVGKDFSARLASAFLAPSRVSFIVYSDTVSLTFGLNSGFTAAQMDAAIKAASQPAMSTNTAAAIDAAAAQLNDNVRGVPKKMVVLTDGVSNYPDLTAAAAARANAAGIKTFSVGIGSFIDDAELLAIAGGNVGNRFKAETFDELLKLIRPVCLKVCER